MFITPDQLLAHAVGDYVLQSDWMATEKTNWSMAAAIHAFCYTLPFLFLTRNPVALAFIAGTHFVIDRWRLARYVCWAKNWLAPGGNRPEPWSDCTATGYDRTKPTWMAVWLLIIVDNIMHVILNGVALQIWG